MFKHVLIPTDGTEFSQNAIKAGIQFAKEIGAKVTGFYAAEEYPIPPFGEYIPPDLLSPEEFRLNEEIRAKRILSTIEKMAEDEDVTCHTLSAPSFSPWNAIVKAAEGEGCDLIFMASHGRKGIASILLGSETNKVVTHTKIPVLVYKPS